MYRVYDNPLKRKWRRVIRDDFQRIFPDKAAREKLSAICLPGAHLLEVEQIYDPLSISNVACVEWKDENYELMLEKAEQRRKDGKPVPSLIHGDIREYLTSEQVKRNQVDIIFIDFDENLQSDVVQDCIEIIARSDILRPSGAIVGMNVFGAREHIEKQCTIKAEAGHDLTDEETIILLLDKIRRDPTIRDIFRVEKIIIPQQPANGGERRKTNLNKERDAFFKKFLIKTMFRGKGLHKLDEELLKDEAIKKTIAQMTDHVLHHLAAVADLRKVDGAALKKRLEAMVAETIIMNDMGFRSSMRERLAKENREFLRRAGISSDGLFSYLIAKCTVPYICTDLLSYYYAWSEAIPMYTDIGYFRRIYGFESKIEIAAMPCEDIGLLLSAKETASVNRAEIRHIRTIISKLKENRGNQPNLFKDRRVLSLEAQDINPDLPTIKTREELVKLIKKDRLTNADDIFDRFNVIGMDYDTVKGIMIRELEKIGRKYLSREERITVQVCARLDQGNDIAEIAKELHMSLEDVERIRQSLQNGKFDYLYIYIDEARFAIEKSSTMIITGLTSAFPAYLKFREWASGCFENIDEIIGLTEEEKGYLDGVESEFSTENEAHLNRVVSAFSYYETYDMKPFQLFRIAQALKKITKKEGQEKQFERIAHMAEVRINILKRSLSAAYPGMPFDGIDDKKIRLNSIYRKQAIAYFGYRMIMEYAKEKSHY